MVSSPMILIDSSMVLDLAGMIGNLFFIFTSVFSLYNYSDNLELLVTGLNKNSDVCFLLSNNVLLEKLWNLSWLSDGRLSKSNL